MAKKLTPKELKALLKNMPRPNLGTIDVSSTEVDTPNYELAKAPESKPLGKGKISIEDLRKIRATTQKEINPNKDLVSGEFNRDVVQHVLDAAKRYNYDPYTALAVALQESQLGNKDFNLGHIQDVPTAIESKLPKLTEAEKKKDFDEYQKKYSADMLVRALMEKKGVAERLGLNDEAQQIQAYNGLGRIFPQSDAGYHGYNMAKIYGVDLPEEGIDMKQNPLYGKQIIDLRENVIKKNPELAEIAKTYINPNAPVQHTKEKLMKIFKSMKGGKASK
jgi:hypothetical protein